MHRRPWSAIQADDHDLGRESLHQAQAIVVQKSHRVDALDLPRPLATARHGPQVLTVCRELHQHLLLHVEQVDVARRIGDRVDDGTQHRVLVAGADAPLLMEDDLTVAWRLFGKLDDWTFAGRSRRQRRGRDQQEERERMARRESEHFHDLTPGTSG
ncbi:MAG: hypothetical protein IPH86_16290 [bacterium]|nr:hypothetical protein [bacterium]